MNDSVVRLGVVQGEYHWHKHDDEDEFFFVVSGRFLIDLEDGWTADLGPGQGFVVPKGVLHRPRAPERTVILMVEGAGIVPTGDKYLVRGGASNARIAALRRCERPETPHPRRAGIRAFHTERGTM